MTDINQYIQTMKNINCRICEFVNSNDQEEKYEDLIQIIKEEQIQENEYKLNEFLHMLSKIADNHLCGLEFFEKIEKIILFVREKAKQFFSNDTIFNFFKNNKRILLFLFKEQIISIDDHIFKFMNSQQSKSNFYLPYFYPEVEFYLKKEKINIYDFYYNRIQNIYQADPSKFEEKRKKGENDSEICELIRNDLIDQFISYVHQNEFPIKSNIERSVFETNSMLLKDGVSLIEYAAFYGSVQIFNYLYKNDVKLSESLWIYAIHSNTEEIINILKENNIKPKNNSYDDCFIEAIKCHHNETAQWIQNYFLKSNLSYSEKHEFFIKILKFYNFPLLENDSFDKSDFQYWVKYDYQYIVNLLLKVSKIDINLKNINKKENTNQSKTALYIAIEKGNTGMVKLLLNQPGIDVNSICTFENNDKYIKNEITPLIAAVQSENVEIVKLLLNRKDLLVNLKTTVQRSSRYSSSWSKVEEKMALHVAIERKNLEIVKLLLNRPDIEINSPKIKYINCNSGENEELTPFHIAIIEEDMDIIRALLDTQKININSKMVIIDKSRYYEDKYHYEKSDNGEIVKKSALYYATENGNLELVKLLLSYPEIDVNSKMKVSFRIWQDCSSESGEGESSITKTSLYAAIENEFVDIVEVLLENPEIDVNTSMTLETEWNRRIYQPHMGRKESREYQNKPALIAAVENENIDIIKLLLEQKNINVNNKYVSSSSTDWEQSSNSGSGSETESYPNDSDDESDSETALHIAVKNYNIIAIKELLKHKDINVNIQDKQGKKPIDYANKQIKALIKKHH